MTMDVFTIVDRRAAEFLNRAVDFADGFALVCGHSRVARSNIHLLNQVGARVLTRERDGARPRSK